MSEFGQGRSPERLEDQARIGRWLVIALAVMVVVAIVLALVQHFTGIDFGFRTGIGKYF